MSPRLIRRPASSELLIMPISFSRPGVKAVLNARGSTDAAWTRPGGRTGSRRVLQRRSLSGNEGTERIGLSPPSRPLTDAVWTLASTSVASPTGAEFLECPLTAITTARESWVLDAACRGSALFIMVAHESLGERLEREQGAKQVCAHCPVRQSCLDYALRVREPLGIWGGLSESERRSLLPSA